MERPVPDVVNVVVLTAMAPANIEKIKAVAPGRINVIQARNDFLDEMKTEWEERSLHGIMSLPPSERTPAEIDEIVQNMHVAIFSHPYPRTLPKRAKNLRWAHFGLAGVSGVQDSDWWGAPFPVSSGRGVTSTLSCAASVIGGVYMLARLLNWGVESTLKGNFDASTYRGRMKIVTGKTLGIVGLGGIGAETARLAKAIGMRCVATRNSVRERQYDVENVEVVYPASEMNEMLGEADFVAVCTMLTDDTYQLINQSAVDAMKPGSYLINIARGKIIDEAPVIAALHSGKLAGAYLDVWDDDFAGPPTPELQNAPNIVITPRIGNGSDVTASGVSGFSIELFCDNLDRLLKGEPLLNVIDWERGY
jgi:phosphoglycerate dehydrogenase-like enzyme